MIPIWLVINSENSKPPLYPIETIEQQLARDMGAPPYPVQEISASTPAQTWAETLDVSEVCLISDPEFWYSPQCWQQWFTALMEKGTGDMINVPLGNQDILWRAGREIPLYLTLPGLEMAATYRGKERWMVQCGENLPTFCVTVVSTALLKLLPDNIKLGDLAAYWAMNGAKVRIFCAGWLHSFNALRMAEAREDLIALTSWQGKVLELGCANGLMAKTCKEKGYDVTWIGIDMHKSALVNASDSLDLAIQADIQKNFPFSEGTRFNRIVCADVLEHIPYPWELLARLRQYISPDGLLVASFPNVGHWAIIEDLIAGRWDETPSGILCVTHLRFGTKKSWQRWFEKSGWEVILWEEEKVPMPPHWHEYHFSSHVDDESLETFRYRILARSRKGQP
jgi:2-polyprenyl-3-methyl-5-hydroxy-6-metoxy-1,4-benzoquinol methylase